MPDAVIAVEGLVKNYRAGMRRSIVHAVRGISLTVPKGSIVAFVGPNGANIEADVLAISATRAIAGIVLCIGIATAISTTGSAPVAVAITMIVAVVPGLIQPLRDDPSPTYQRIGAALDAVVHYTEQRKRSAEAAGYAGVYFLLGCVAFARRDLKFR